MGVHDPYATLELGEPLAVLPSTFWAVVAHMPSGAPDPALAADVNATPLAYYRYGVDTDSTNQTTGQDWQTGGKWIAWPNNDSQFVTWCAWVHCRAILGVPAETNDPGAAVATMRYVEDTLHFHPAYWSIGNEPSLWTHYNIPWSDWKSSDRSSCSATCYESLATRFVRAMHAFDPSAKIIPLQLTGCETTAYVTDVAKIPGISAIACHLYPADHGPSQATLAAFFATLEGVGGRNLTQGVEAVRASVAAGCGHCDVPVFLDEYNSAHRGGYDAYIHGYPDTVYVAASFTQAARINLSQFAFFVLDDGTVAGGIYSMIWPTNDSGEWMYELYRYFFDRLALPEVVSTTVRTTVGMVFSIETASATGRSLLVVNANVTDGLTLDLTGSGYPTAHGATLESWSGARFVPTTTRYASGSVPSRFILPPESLWLLNV